jgi:hypothetical protein
MPTATGSIAFLGAARFQGFWNANTNAASGSGLPGEIQGTYTALLADGAYHLSTNLTASSGDYWQVTGSGTTSIDSQTDWDLNDWVIYSGSAGGSDATWRKLAFEDTIASIVLGDLSSSSFHMGAEVDKHVIFASGSVHSGSNNFIFDYNIDKVSITGTLGVTGNTTLTGTLYVSSNARIDAPIMGIAHGNHALVSVDTTIPDGHNAKMYGPITIATGKTLYVAGNTVLQITDIS